LSATDVNFRRITSRDIEVVASYAIEGMQPGLYPLHVDRAKVRAVIGAFVEPSHDNFQLAAFVGDKMVGGIAAAVMPLLFFERCEAHVVMCRATLPGAGLRLLRALRQWADADMRIRRVVWPIEFHADPRIAKMAARAGFSNQLTVATYYK
jgi:hypothetical protein